MVRIGIGFDLHRFQKGRQLYLGGLEINYPEGLAGHSDGDVVLHAICDAILGALAKPDIGCLFPDTDPSLKGMNSAKIVKKIREIMSEAAVVISNLDIIIVCQAPKLSPVYQDIRKNLANLFDISPEQIGVKAKTAEHLGPLGQGKAIACWASVLLQPVTSRI
ncbi:MAG: 2-C-methyl-D-erythritol 2,4-cyclodiphosphate synthase [Candidatus Omnitrophica bacterium]|nr:2-C-methyl-D-erythritol 2,4-cyclodiphosphate synthase [Candidatus Omnitrophota bacterium]